MPVENPICSVLIPTFNRVQKLKRAVNSIYATGKDFEVILRVNFGDAETINTFHNDDRVKMILGSRLNGYASVGVFFEEMAAVSKAPWVWIFNDDASISGKGWDDQLKEIPTKGFIVQPEFHQLNASMYRFHEGGAFPIVPRGSWRITGKEIMPTAADTFMDQQLRFGRGWKTRFLHGIKVFHDREEPKPSG